MISRRRVSATVLLLGGLLIGTMVQADEVTPKVWVSQPPARGTAEDMVLTDSRGRTRQAGNQAAGVPGTTITVEFAVDSSQLQDNQRDALRELARNLKRDRSIKLLWIQPGVDHPPYETGDAALAAKRGDVVRRALASRGFPWKKMFVDGPAQGCDADECRLTNRHTVITVIQSR